MNKCLRLTILLVYLYRKGNGPGDGCTTSSPRASHGSGWSHLTQKALQPVPHIQQSQRSSERTLVQSKNVSNSTSA